MRKAMERAARWTVGIVMMIEERHPERREDRRTFFPPHGLNSSREEAVCRSS